METKPTQPSPETNLLDKIAADPEIINRSASEAVGAEITAPADSLPKIHALPTAEGVKLMDGQGGFGAPTFNFLTPRDPESAAGPAPAVAAAAAVKPKRKVWPMVAAAAVVVAALGGGGYYLYAKNASNSQVAVATPSPTPASTPSPTPAPPPDTHAKPNAGSDSSRGECDGSGGRSHI